MNPSIANKARILRTGVLGGKLGRNIGWLTGAELVSRLGRLVTAVVLARQLDALAFGVAAIAITIFELVRVFTENGIGAAVVRAEADRFHQTANTANRLMWGVCLGLFVIQILIGIVVELILPSRSLGPMIASLSIVFLIMPFGLVHAYCLQRTERMKHLAAVSSSQALADHFLTAILALSGFGAWALILPKLLTAPVWLIGVRYTKPWARQANAGYAPTSEILAFSLPVLGAELLSAFRDQLDKLLVSVMFGIEALGLYYFAFNAGLGVSTALNRAFSQAIYPHLCGAANKAVAYRKAILRHGLPLSLAYVFQAAAAFLYVPIVFGSNWAHAAPLVALLCLGGPARLMVDGARLVVRADGRSLDDCLMSLGLAACVLVPFAAMTPYGLYPAAFASFLCASIYAAIVTRRSLNITLSAKAIS